MASGISADIRKGPARLAHALRRAGAAALILCALPAAAEAQPLSAIDWLSDSVQTPQPPSRAGEPAVAVSVIPEDVSVIPLGAAPPDAAGLIGAESSGMPRQLWGPTAAADLARVVRQARADMLPAPQQLLMTILLAEVDAPFDADIRGVLFLARVDKLLDIGALDQAAALMEQAGITRSAEIFRRAFDVALLTGDEDRLCAVMQTVPALSPTYPARIFCQARGGDWDTAALTYGTARALGFLDPRQEILLGRFLDPELFEEDELPPRQGPVTPLEFRLLEAIGEPPVTATLPRAFAHLDLRAVAGWKAQIEAAERLARPGAIAPDQLLALYADRKPAASGGVWERASAVQALDRAIADRNRDRIAELLPGAWERMAAAELEPVLAAILVPRMQGIELDGTAGSVLLRLRLLTPGFRSAAQPGHGLSDTDRLLVGVASGNLPPISPRDMLGQAIAEGLTATAAPSRVSTLIAGRRTGEALLRAAGLLASGAAGDLDELTDGLATLKSLGFDDLARRAALELLILDRRG